MEPDNLPHLLTEIPLTIDPDLLPPTIDETQILSARLSQAPHHRRFWNTDATHRLLARIPLRIVTVAAQPLQNQPLLTWPA